MVCLIDIRIFFFIFLCINTFVCSTRYNEELDLDIILYCNNSFSLDGILTSLRGGNNDQPQQPSIIEAEDTINVDKNLESVDEKDPHSTETEGTKKETTGFGRGTIRRIGDVKHRIVKGWSRRGQYYSRINTDGSILESMKNKFHDIKSKQLDLDLDYRMAVDVAKSTVSKVHNTISGPVVSAILSQLCDLDENKPLTTVAVFGLALLGSSLGFHSFLYFVSIGFGLAVGLIAATALVAFNSLSKHPIPLSSNIHTFLMLLWSIRLILFLLHREYVNWPEWHLKIYEVNQRAKMGAKYYVWSTVGPFYAMMTLPCIYRLQAFASNTNHHHHDGCRNKNWSLSILVGILFQVVGLILETIADIQKASFKSRTPENRYRWCQEGLWGFSTHPNYFGELLFWAGTYIGGWNGYESLGQWILATVGFIFIACVLKDACDTVGAKHLRNYGQNMDFMEFRRTHNILGPFPKRSNTIL